MRDQLDAFARHLAAGHAAARTIKTYGAVISSLTAALPKPTHQPTRAQVEAFLGRRRQDGTPRAASTRNQEFAAIRAFVSFARDELGWTTDPTKGINFVREPRRIPAVLSAPELSALFEAATRASRPHVRSRDLALLAVLSQAALRVHEAVALDLNQVDLSAETLLSVRGKGGTLCDIPLNRPAVELLRDWIAVRGAPVGEAALFLSGRGTRLSIRAVEALLQRLRRAMGTAKKITPHTLRHTAATLTLTAGTDLATVGELLRHSDLNTTRVYLHLVDTRRREAVRRLEATIPASVLPRRTPTPPAPPHEESREPPETLDSRRKLGLDDQCGLVAAA
ncbi:MAG: tyrosine-type recombinase/integrase [Deltaproteobacteria bacterium]|nr:tyrosine-type recombinase/integrase [Deltaproteobacteria bacterium]